MNFFEFEDEFKNNVDMFVMPNKISEVLDYNIIKTTVAFTPPELESSHIIQKENYGMVISSNESVLLGKMSFQITTTDEFDINWFHIEENENEEPHSGLKINLDAEECITEKTAFKFKDETASKDATLNNLIVSREVESGPVEEGEELNPPITKVYELTPVFNPETLEYEITLLEEIDTLDITAIPNHENATMLIKVPKRDEEGKLVYEVNEGEGDPGEVEEPLKNLVYEEKELLANTKTNITLNELGKEATKVTIKVTAEDGKTINEYVLAIKRPFGTIKGQIYAPPMANKNEHIATVRVYENSKVIEKINWDEIITGKKTTVHSNLLSIKSKDTITNTDGSYEIYVIPGKYDVLIDKTGYLDHIFIEKEIQEGDTLDLGQVTLNAGDINKDGTIQLMDLTMLSKIYGIADTDNNFDERADFNCDGRVQLMDLTVLSKNYLIEMEIDR